MGLLQNESFAAAPLSIFAGSEGTCYSIRILLNRNLMNFMRSS